MPQGTFLACNDGAPHACVDARTVVGRPCKRCPASRLHQAAMVVGKVTAGAHRSQVTHDDGRHRARVCLAHLDSVGGDRCGAQRLGNACDSALQGHGGPGLHGLSKALRAVRLNGHHGHIRPPIALEPNEHAAQKSATAYRHHNSRRDRAIKLLLDLVDHRGVALPNDGVFKRWHVARLTVSRLGYYLSDVPIGLVPDAAVHHDGGAERLNLVPRERRGGGRHHHCRCHAAHHRGGVRRGHAGVSATA